MYCMSSQDEISNKRKKHRNSCDKKFKNNGIKECFKEYSLEDKIEALKTILTYNEKHTEDLSSHRDIICNIRKTIGVKECLQAKQETPFQTIISELRNTVMDSYWNKEVGKTRYQVPNLPVGMNPLEETFGKTTKSRETMAELLKTKISENILDQNILEMYKKSHNSYQPAEQIKRNYKKPFNENLYFGKPRNIDIRGTRVKRLLTWINSDPVTIVNSILAEFMERSHSRVGEVKNLKNAYLYINMIHGKSIKKEEKHDMANILSDCTKNSDMTLQQQYLQYINTLRLKLKKNISNILFADISEELSCIDKDYIGCLPEDKVFSTLIKYKIYVNKTLLVPLLDLLQIREGKNVNYQKLLNLLNWKHHFPTLPKIKKIPVKCQYYSTIYKETIGNLEKIDIADIPTAGILSETLEDKTSAYDLIFPNIFTRHGLSKTDLTKLRSKEEIRSIFENIGVQFPENNFDMLWEKGLEESATDSLSVEVFRNLINQHNSIIINKDS